MQFKAIRFNTKSNPEFFSELRNRVNTYFEENKISPNANAMMVFKTIFMVSLYFIPLIYLLVGGVETLSLMFLMWVLMGFGMAGIGLSIMHDANHGAYSKNKNINNALGLLLNTVGGYHVNWKIQHNVLHHSFTNIFGYDEDIEKAILRLTPDQPHRPFHRFQIFYAPLLYSIMTFYWVVSKDFEQLVRYNRKGLYKGQGLSYRRAIWETILTKVLYFFVTLVLPIWILPFAWWQVFLGFLTMHFIGGMILALIFQPAHVSEDTQFFIPEEGGSVENNWAIHQMLTTTNFANKSTLFSWYVGGLNYQVEHHLFPNICHVHYKSLSKIVKETAAEYNLPYLERKTFVGAVASHFKLLYRLGMNKA